MDDFIIDTVGDIGRTEDNLNNDSNKSIVATLLKEYDEEKSSACGKSLHKLKATQNNKPLVDTFMEKMGWTKPKSMKKTLLQPSVELTAAKRDTKEILKKSVISPDFEKKHTVPPFEISERKRREERRKQASLTKGDKWYGLPATEMTEEVKNDLELLQMRSVLDNKRFYKKNDLKVIPKYFQIGHVLDSPLDYYSSRLTKKERKKTLVDELLADAEFSQYNKRKYKEIIDEKQKTHYKAWRQAKKLKKKNK